MVDRYGIESATEVLFSAGSLTGWWHRIGADADNPRKNAGMVKFTPSKLQWNFSLYIYMENKQENFNKWTSQILKMKLRAQ